ncbi:MAG TPA: hypothetical protein VGI85_00625 [Chthoniobacterales bacterium]|jgi:TolB-like protein/Tfp pilus assembly protein PilF
MSGRFLEELKRRHVYKVAAAYAITGWVLIEIATQIFPVFHFPEWVAQLVVLLILIGFPIAVVLAWAFDATPEGVVRTADAPNTSPHRSRRAGIAVGLVGTLIAVAAGGGYWWWHRPPARTDNAAAPRAMTASADASLPIPAKSIAVLPFENLSAEKENAYFVEGIQDEILTRLAKVSALKVISRTSTMRYASRPDNLREIGRELGVASILEGSVQRDAGAVRVNLQLIDAGTDTHLWAETYDREVKNIFSVESEVAQQVADALKATLLPAESARIANVPTKSTAAYDLFLKGQYLFNQLQTSAAKDPVAVGQSATDFYRRAVADDPTFALASARLSYLESYQHWYGVDNRAEIIDAARADADRALALQPDLPEAHLALGYVHYWCHRDYPAALREFGIARASLPNNAEVIAAIGYVHRRQGDPGRGVPEMQQAAVLDPRDSVLPREIANSYVAMRRYAAADAAYARSLALFPGDIEAQVQRATSMVFAGKFEAAGRILAGIPRDTDPQGSVSLIRYRIAMLMRQPDAALATIAHAPDWVMTRWEHSLAPAGLLRGEALSRKGEKTAARAAFLAAERQLQPLLDRPNEIADAQSYLGLVYAGLGEKEAALRAGRAAVEALPVSHDSIVGAFYLERLARTEARVGETQSAIEHIEQLLSTAGGETISTATLRIDPAWDSIRQDSRFAALLTRFTAVAEGAANE